jgi:transposase
MRRLYAGTDLHSNNNFLGIIDGKGKKIFKKRLPNDPRVVLENLEPFRKKMVGIVVEFTYNWYWLVDALMREGYPGLFVKNSLKIPNLILTILECRIER